MTPDIRYWLKIIHTDNLLLRNAYYVLRNDAINNHTYNGNNWAYNVKTMLDNLGLGFIWENEDTPENSPYDEIKQQLFDNASQELLMSINTSTKLDTYPSLT